MENCYFTDPFESALTSMVSSPTPTSSNDGGFITGDGMMIRELIGRLGSLCDSGEISPQSCIRAPLNSPPKFAHNSSNFPYHPPNLAFFNGDPGFDERAAQFSSLGRGEMEIHSRSVAPLQNGKILRANSQLNWNSGVPQNKFGVEIENEEIMESRDASSVSEQNPVGEFGSKPQNYAISRKRKSISQAKVKQSLSLLAKDYRAVDEAKNEESSNSKRSKTEQEGVKKENAGHNSNSKDNNNNDIDNSNSNNNNDNNNNNNNNNNDIDNNNNSNSNSKETAKPEPPKDYIHVRARRGQAIDSHSLAERARREKISERMKFLQDLVPGCNKVTGKATVLDEIINYVQSLQHQVEFLSMKLATVNPTTDFNMEALLSKDMFEYRTSELPQKMYALDQSSTQVFPFGLQPSLQMPPTLLNGIPNVVETLFSVPRSTDPMAQLHPFWEDDLQSIVRMGIAQNQTQTRTGTSSMPR